MTSPFPFRHQHDIAAFAAVPLEQRIAGRDLGAMLIDLADGTGDTPALRYLPSGTLGNDDEQFSRRQLVHSAAAIAETLRNKGIGSDDVVASLLPNGPGTIAAALGSMSIGTLAPINIYLDERQIVKLIQESQARAVLVPRRIPSAISNAMSAVRERPALSGVSLIEIDTDTLLPNPFDKHVLAVRRLTDRVALFHTGGTTGLPKFVPLSARHLAAGAIISQFAYGYNETDDILCGMPMFHVGGLFACGLFPLVAGGVVTILGALGYRGDGVLTALPQTIVSTCASVVVGPPTVMANLANAPPDRTNIPRLRLFINGAAALPRVIGRRLADATGVHIVEPWGLTEATLAVTCGPRDGAVRQGSVGLALPYCEVKAVRSGQSADEIKNCDADEIGLLVTRGPMVFEGYLNRPRNQQPFLKGDWLDTGDLGRVDRDGYVWVTGRAKELIKRGGHGIDPAMIEDALMDHPAVALAAAVGKPDAYAGEIPVAYVQLHPGAVVGEGELLAFAQTRIPERAAVPKEIVTISKLPITAIGKVHKQTLKLDMTRRVAEAAARGIVAPDEAMTIAVDPHALHGIMVSLGVPRQHVEALRDIFAAFPFQTEIVAFGEKENRNA